LHELCWNNAQDATFAADAATGIVVDANPAAQAMMGYSREELIGMHVTMLHPESERERAAIEFQESLRSGLLHSSFHIQRKDGSCVPVAIWSSPPLELAGRSLMIAEFRNITKLQEHEHRLATKRWAINAYAGTASALWLQHSSESLPQAICDAITRESNYVLAWVGMAENGPDKKIKVAAAAGSAVGYLDGVDLSWSEEQAWGKSPTGVCIRTNTLQTTEDTQTSPRFATWRERAMQFGIRSSVSTPLQLKSGLYGALIVYAASPNAFEPVVIEVFEHLAEQISFGVHAIEQEKRLQAKREQLARTERQLTEALSAMVAPIVLAMEMRDPYTSGHQGRVADIAVAIGKEMGWPEGRLQGLRVAAQVHDIGKISIPAEILTKPGELNAPERAMINGHSEVGYTILKDIPFVWPIAEIVRQHHEKLDGSGYPRGLKADEILPEAKILTVADIVEAMASYRPYRAGIPLDAVLEQIEKEAGSQLDAEVVQICVDLFREKNFAVPGWTRL
jgi:PAS domain S-box-containing protein